MEYTYNDYVQYVRQQVVGVHNTQLLSELRPHFTTLKQKISNNQEILETYNAVSISIASEIDNCASNATQLSNFVSKFDNVVRNLNIIGEGIQHLLEQPRLSSGLRNEVVSFQKDCSNNLTFHDTQSAVEKINALKSKFLSEEEERKAKQMALIIQVLKWVGIVIGALIVMAIIATYWKIIVTILVIGLIGAIVSFYSKK